MRVFALREQGHMVALQARCFPEDNGGVGLLESSEVPEVGVLAVVVTTDSLAILKRHIPSRAHNISAKTISLTIAECHEPAHVRPLIYFICAATKTTMLFSGSVSIRAFLRPSYSSVGMPGVSSPALTMFPDKDSVQSIGHDKGSIYADADVTESEAVHIR